VQLYELHTRYSTIVFRAMFLRLGFFHLTFRIHTRQHNTTMSAYDTRDKVFALGDIDTEVTKVNARIVSKIWLY
jgi:hypothetical protein